MKYKDLIHNTKDVSPTSLNEAGTRKTSDLNLFYDQHHKIMTFTGKISGSNGYYDWQVDFLDVEPTDYLTPEEVMAGRYPKPSISKNDIKVFCNCSSFRFTFANANKMHNAKTGPEFPEYIRKTDRASRNPSQEPGLCKHLITVITELMNEGFIVK